jgi:hypothetical protein
MTVVPQPEQDLSHWIASRGVGDPHTETSFPFSAKLQSQSIRGLNGSIIRSQLELLYLFDNAKNKAEPPTGPSGKNIQGAASQTRLVSRSQTTALGFRPRDLWQIAPRLSPSHDACLTGS